MGLSASQARLLSITQRLNNNELESQLISNSKVQLSTKNSLATEKYIAALDSTEMSYISYDTSGTAETVALTFNSLMSYSPLKNQYSLYNSQGQLMVSEEDAMNFETSQTLSEFLMKNGLDDYWSAYNEELMKYNSEYAKYETELKNYYEEKLKYEEDLKDYYENQLPAYETKVTEYNIKLADYNTQMTILNTLGNPYTEFTNVVGSYANGTQSSCYAVALENAFDECYLHVLGHLLNPSATPQNFTTSTGDTVTVSNSDVYGSSLGTDATLLEKSRGAVLFQKDGEYYLKCDGDDALTSYAEGGDGTKENSLSAIIAAGGTPSKLQLLLSDYVYDSTNNTATEVKSLAQKTIDMMYLIKEIKSLGLGRKPTDTSITLFGETLTKDQMKDVLINFTEGDMKNLRPTVPTLDSAPTFPTLDATHPTLPTFTYNFEYPVADKEKAQWYTNLWYAMDGQKITAQLGTENDENAVFKYFTVSDTRNLSDMEIINATYNGDGTIKTINKAKQLNQYYVVIDKENATDSSWIQYMLTSGMVTMQQAALRTTGYVTWEGIEFSSTSDIKEIQDDTKVAKAEAEYEEAIAQIQAEDKILDAKVKKLDTEHSALKTEIESIKNVMTKNIEKSFNTFS